VDHHDHEAVLPEFLTELLHPCIIYVRVIKDNTAGNPERYYPAATLCSRRAAASAFLTITVRRLLAIAEDMHPASRMEQDVQKGNIRLESADIGKQRAFFRKKTVAIFRNQGYSK
jgi:hypothetical protein